MSTENKFKQHPNIKEIALDFKARIEGIKTLVILFETEGHMNYRLCCPSREYAIRLMQILQESLVNEIMRDKGKN